MRVIKGYFAILVLVLTVNACVYAVRSVWGHPPSRGSISGKLYEYTAVVMSAAQDFVGSRKDAAPRLEERTTPPQKQNGAPKGRQATPVRQPEAAAATPGTAPK